MKPISPLVTRIVVIGLLLAALAVGSLLLSLGLSVGAAVALAFLIVGVAATALERRMGREAPVFGITMFTIAAIAGIAATVHAIPQINGKVVGFSTLAVEILALYGFFKLYRALSTKTGSVLRQRLAQRRGWRYEREATVPVPGPLSAPRLRGVPGNVTTTTGRDVVHASANGLEVTVFDRIRANERNAKAQTVWLVRLPMALPFVLSSYARYLMVQERGPGAPEGRPISMTLLDPTNTSASGLGASVDQALGLPPIVPGRPQDHTAEVDFADALMTPPVRHAAASSGLPTLWWIEGHYLCTVRDDDERTGSKPAVIESTVDTLTAFAAGLPWPALATYATA